ncbi:hypothetical protein PproGo58_10090 [Pseudomonas protegens]|nr:hypothetical protein PproGo58_10090 [Pseudomonas protegens]
MQALASAGHVLFRQQGIEYHQQIQIDIAQGNAGHPVFSNWEALYGGEPQNNPVAQAECKTGDPKAARAGSNCRYRWLSAYSARIERGTPCKVMCTPLGKSLKRSVR